jgi:serine/threonine protein kinase
VQEHIGGGGMADVYRATDQQLGIDVAIKLLKPRMASDELRARMVQEAQAAAQVRHSHVVRVFGTGALDRTAFIVMEWLDGPNLEQYLREYRGGRMPVREAIELLVPAIEALHEIHEQGYVHRDIKTGNILITRIPGQPPAAVVIDLGLVKPDRALRNAASPPTTEIGRLLCTPGYTSPEQAAGNPVDRRSDVYSMAVTLYRVLAGRLPFHDARGQPLALLAKHIYNAPTMLAEAAGTADIPVGVAAVVEGALSKDPAKRPQTMQAFADELRAALDEQPAAAPQLIRLRQTRTLLLAFGLGMLSTWLLTPSTTCPPAPAVNAVAVPLVAPSVGGGRGGRDLRWSPYPRP